MNPSVITIALCPSMPNAIRDRSGVLQRIGTLSQVQVELGCGNRKRSADFIGIDTQDVPGVDIVGDAFEVLCNFPDSSVDKVTSFHFLEHVGDLEQLLKELARVIKLNGTLDVVVPHFSNPYFYSDYTHKRTFGLYSFCYLAKSRLFRRTVPTYGRELAFELIAVRLGFKSARVFLGRNVIKRAVGTLFNSTTYLQELWEENFCYIFPCYEIHYQLRRIAN